MYAVVIKISVMLCTCVGDSLQVKIETDGDKVGKIKTVTEAESNDVTEWPFVVHPCTGMCDFFDDTFSTFVHCVRRVYCFVSSSTGRL